MNGSVYDIFRQPLGFSGIGLWVVPIILVATLQSLVLLHLGLRSVGVRRAVWDGWTPALGISVIGFFSRRLLMVHYHVLLFTLMLFLLILMVGRINILSAIIATIFSQVVAACGDSIVLEPLMLLANGKSISIMSPPIYCLGIIIETLVPAVVLFIFIRYKTSLFGRMRKEAS